MNYAYTKANKSLGLIKRTVKFKATDVMLRLYKAVSVQFHQNGTGCERKAIL